MVLQDLYFKGQMCQEYHQEILSFETKRPIIQNKSGTYDDASLPYVVPLRLSPGISLTFHINAVIIPQILRCAIKILLLTLQM